MSNDENLSFAATIAVRDACLCLHLQRAARAVGRHFDKAFRPFGLTNGQFSLLMSLNQPQPPTIGSIAALLAMDRTTLTANLKPLVRRGLVTIACDEEDRRSRRLILTREGRRLLAAAMATWRETHGAIEALVGNTGADRLRAALRALS
jgi:DNA-binding MarR family transcriptional regulator